MFRAENSHTISGFSISIPKCSFTKSTAERIDRYESLLQQRDPPIEPMASRDFEVIRLESPNGSPARGVEPDMMETNIPELQTCLGLYAAHSPKTQKIRRLHPVIGMKSAGFFDERRKTDYALKSALSLIE